MRSISGEARKALTDTRGVCVRACVCARACDQSLPFHLRCRHRCDARSPNVMVRTRARAHTPCSFARFPCRSSCRVRCLATVLTTAIGSEPDRQEGGTQGTSGIDIPPFRSQHVPNHLPVNAFPRRIQHCHATPERLPRRGRVFPSWTCDSTICPRRSAHLRVNLF